MISANLKTVIIEIGIKYTAKKVYNLTHFCICSSHDLFYGVYSIMETLHGHNMAMEGSAVNTIKLLNLRSLVSSR